MIFAVNSEGWSPSDHFGLWQLIVGALGFGVAIWQLTRTANASERSAEILARRLLHNDLLVLLPEIHRLEDDVDKALRANDLDIVSNALVSYSRRVSTVVGHLKADDRLKDERLVKLLGQAAKGASIAKSNLYGAGGRDLTAVTRPAIEKMRAASTEVNELTARLQKGAQIGEARG